MSATDNNNDNNDNAAAGGAHDNMASITTILESLMVRLDRMEQAGGRTQSSDREVTPDESVFGGKAFRPTGYAALSEFSPYGVDPNAKNPAYDNRARQSQYKPGVFTGDRDYFDRWVTQIADKCRCDDETFKVERDRIVMIVSYLDETPAKLINSRYISAENPFRSAAEVIATLTGVYQDDNQASRARRELEGLMFDPRQGEDIKQFIGRVNV
ncbi:uncharacterized protein CPUR_07731 [Claviceps purpurea 20.1]|uniref:Uncharacterized protein n=1 Tax=Claviceps purpurea (strain 20.1) TaxID=1111077 RepID=M1WI38_CLAP2|nr:uncharacterized protein CPUR_07731 [Claviceps purpurea 20.1]